MKPIIEFRDVDINNGDTIVIESLNMIINKGEFVYITGKVGSGKTSIIKTIIAENSCDNGYAEVVGFDLLKMKRKQIPSLRRALGIVFQDFQLLMERSVKDNLEFVLKATGWKNKYDINDRIDYVLSLVGMKTKSHKMPHQLSGGEQQRVAIARALLNEPEVIIADEPTGNLDNETAKGIMDLLDKINKENSTAIIMITHNTNIVRQYPGRLFVCESGECNELSDDLEEIVFDFDESNF
jgi:cell division transport system ATP-binding protein